MASKYEVLSRLFKDELLQIASTYNISVAKSWQKMDIVNTIGDRLTAAEIKKLVNQYTEAENKDEEDNVEAIDEPPEEIKLEETPNGTKSEFEFLDLLQAIKAQKFTRDELIDETKKKGIKLTTSGLSNEEILKMYPKFADYLRSMLLGTATGKGLEFRTYRWLQSDRYIKEMIKYQGGELTMEHNVSGSTRLINFDIYFRVPETGFRKKGFLEGFVECKHYKGGISDNLISIFQGQVEDVCSRTGKSPIFAKFVTSSYFIQSAKDFAKHHPIRTKNEDVKIELWQEREPGVFSEV